MLAFIKRLINSFSSKSRSAAKNAKTSTQISPQSPKIEDPIFDKVIAHCEFMSRNPETYLENLRTYANELPDDVVANFRNRYNIPANLPELENKYPGFSQWLLINQKFIFDMYYARGSRSLKELYGFAFGEYDWTQTDAIYCLAQLVMDGIASERFIVELISFAPQLRDPMVAYRALRAFPDHPAVVAFYKSELVNEYPPENFDLDGFYLMGLLAEKDPATLDPYIDVLNGLIHTDVLDSRSIFLDERIIMFNQSEAEIQESNRKKAIYQTLHKINAAIILTHINKVSANTQQFIDSILISTNASTLLEASKVLHQSLTNDK